MIPSFYAKPYMPKEGQRPLATGGVYFVGCQGFVKIGRATDIRQRLIGLQSSAPFDLHLYGVIEIRSESDQCVTEREMHELFTPFRVRGEWFKLDPQIEDFIVELPPVAAPGHDSLEDIITPLPNRG